MKPFEDAEMLKNLDLLINLEILEDENDWQNIEELESSQEELRHE